MTTWAVLASGPSLTQSDVDRVRHLPCIAVSDAYVMAPWAQVLLSMDKAWWEEKRPTFAGRKMCAHAPKDVEGVERITAHLSSINSGAAAIFQASTMGATKIILLGFDMSNKNGSHFFGKHLPPLKETTEVRFKVFHAQFKTLAWQMTNRGVFVVNCTPGTALEAFPVSTLAEQLGEVS